MSVADVIIHIDETLNESERERIVQGFREVPGVISPRFNEGKDHMLALAFDPAEIDSRGLLEKVRNQGYHAELIGL